MNARSISVILLCFLILVSSVRAESDDEYWKKKAEAAYAEAKDSYTPDPFAVTNSFNNEVDK